jgi:hypothetical protein
MFLSNGFGPALVFSRGQLILFSSIVGALLSISEPASAVMIAAKSASFADVSSAVLGAKDGDTVTIPAGTATWTASLTITNNITLQGAGAGATIIINEIERPPREGGKGLNQPGAAQEKFPVERLQRGKGRSGRAGGAIQSAGSRRQPALIFVSLEKDLPFRMSGFTFKGGAVNTQKTSNGEIRISGNSHSFRVDHCTFEALHGTNLGTSGFLWGVIDHCQFNLRDAQPIKIDHATWNGGDHGNGSWADDPYWGSEKFVFIEDNVFDGAPGGINANEKGFIRGIDANDGARFVVRHNIFHNCGLAAHGTEGAGRGTKQIEEYNNTFRYDHPTPGKQIRSGCVITHDNTSTNLTKGHVLQAYRQFSYSPHWNWANGQNPYDDNAPKETTGYWEKGTHTGADGAAVLTDSSKNWTSDQWYQPGVAYILRNKTKEEKASRDADKLQSFIVSNTTNTIEYSERTRGGPVFLTFNKGDVYEIWKINHSLDQPGLGRGDLLRGLPGSPAKWPNQVTEPCYSWNDMQDGKPINLSSTEPSIQEGRDFFNGKPKPGYKPYVYPHPLVSGAAPHP